MWTQRAITGCRAVEYCKPIAQGRPGCSGGADRGQNWMGWKGWRWPWSFKKLPPPTDQAARCFHKEGAKLGEADPQKKQLFLTCELCVCFCFKESFGLLQVTGKSFPKSLSGVCSSKFRGNAAVHESFRRARWGNEKCKLLLCEVVLQYFDHVFCSEGDK